MCTHIRIYHVIICYTYLYVGLNCNKFWQNTKLEEKGKDLENWNKMLENDCLTSDTVFHYEDGEIFQ